MQVKTKAIVISALKYQERSLIVKCFTASDGLKSYFVANAFSNKKNQQKAGYFQPLTLLEIEATHKNKGTLEYFKEIRMSHVYQTISSDVVKSTIVMFLSEVLHHSIHEEEKNENLFQFLEAALLWLDTHDHIANFHLYILIEMTKYFGFYPDNVDDDLDFFDSREGVFSTFQGINCLSKQETDLFKKAIALKLETTQNVFSVNERQLLLKILVDYYALHLDGFKKPKSIEVFKAIFSN
ncbi:DNA repair protein RecO [Flavobacterium sp. UBA6135]|uniref:DNA repair protein RecO n=1 Tax=Flavobacterium sp. UBA6135 TaxID=1946553 RepID=UPI0025B81B12|nr:DNA repair protein RecO [Flavobacterium sp. UBA6135]